MSDFNPAEYVTVPEGWSCKRLADCTIDGNISYGIVQPGQHDDYGIPVIRVNNVNNGKLDLSDVLKVSPEVEKKYQRTRLKGGEVLLTLVGSTGQSFVAPSKLAGWNVPRAIAVIRANDEVGADWINICLQSKETMHFLNVRANTTVQKTLNLKDVRDIPILIPPKEIKESIQGMALSLSEKIELNRQTNQTLEQIAQAIFKSWFVDFDPTRAKIAAKEEGADPERAAMAAISGKSLGELEQLSPDQLQQLKETAALFPDALVESELGEVPEGWVIGKVGDMFELHRGFDLPKKDRKDGEYPVFAAGGFHGFNADFKMEPPGIITGRSGVIGNVYLSLDRYWPLNTTLYVREFKKCGPYFAYFYLNNIDLKSINSGSAVPSLNRNFVHGLTSIVPEGLLLEIFDKKVEFFFKKIKANDKEIILLSSIRDAILPKLLSGELLYE